MLGSFFCLVTVENSKDTNMSPPFATVDEGTEEATTSSGTTLYMQAYAQQQGINSSGYATSWTLAAEGSGGLPTQFGNSKFVFRCRRAGDYKVDFITTLAHSGTGLKNTTLLLEKFKLYTLLTNDFIVAAASYDFRQAVYTAIADTTVLRQYPLEGQGDFAAELNVDANEPNPTITTADGVQGSPGSFIALRSNDIPLHNHIGTGSTGFSFEFSMRVNNNTNGALLDVDVPNGNFVNSLFKVFHVSTAGTLSIVYIDNTGSQVINSGINFNQNAFVHFVITVEGGGTMRVYQDKVLSNTFTGNPMGTNGNNVTGVRIGRQNNPHGGSLRDGCTEQIRFLRFYTSVLTQSSVSDLYNAHVLGESSSLVMTAGDQATVNPPQLYQQMNMHTIVNLAVDDRLAISYSTAGAFTLGTFTNLFVTSL